MAQAKKIRGLFERPPDSGLWWIHWYDRKGKRHREKVGRKSDAIKLYQLRKADVTAGRKLPELQPGKVITFAHLMQDAVEHAKAHLKTASDYEWKQRALFDDFGSIPADEIPPQDLDRWLTKNTKTPATANRFRAFFSLCYRLGMENGKVKTNPARLVRARKEDNGRIRYLSREEFDKLLEVIRRDYPRQAPAFIVSVYTGMRWSEQFSLTWADVNLKRKVIHLRGTKDPTGKVAAQARNVPLNSAALAGLEDQHELVPHGPTEPVFPEAGDYCRFWFEPALAEAKIKGYTWHCNRHTFCSWLAIAGVSLKEIQELAGHKTIAMAARYAHLSPDVTLTATERMVQH